MTGNLGPRFLAPTTAARRSVFDICIHSYSAGQPLARGRLPSPVKSFWAVDARAQYHYDFVLAVASTRCMLAKEAWMNDNYMMNI